MKFALKFALKFVLTFSFVALFTPPASACDQTPVTAASPLGKVQVSFCLIDGAPAYSVNYEQKSVLRWSALGFDLKDQPPFAPDLRNHLQIIQISRSTFDEAMSWDMKVSSSVIAVTTREFPMVLRISDCFISIRLA